jgi:hypothetical protein
VIEPALLGMMTTPVVWTPFLASSGSGFGDPTYDAGAAKTVLASIQGGTWRVMSRAAGKEGQLVDSRQQIFARPTCTDGSPFLPRLKDKLTLPAVYDPTEPPIIAVDPKFDEQLGTLNHVVVHL